LEISHKGFFILENVLYTCTQLQNLHGSILLDVSFAEILCVDNLFVFKFSSIGKRKNIKGLFFVVLIIRFSVLLQLSLEYSWQRHSLGEGLEFYQLLEEKLIRVV